VDILNQPNFFYKIDLAKLKMFEKM